MHFIRAPLVACYLVFLLHYRVPYRTVVYMELHTLVHTRSAHIMNSSLSSWELPTRTHHEVCHTEVGKRNQPMSKERKSDGLGWVKLVPSLIFHKLTSKLAGSL